MSDDLVERVAQAMWMADVEPYDPADRIPFEQAPEGAQAYCRAEARAAIAVVLEQAAKVCDAIGTKLSDQWRAGYKVCDYTQGASDGANDCAAAIRALVKHD